MPAMKKPSAAIRACTDAVPTSPMDTLRTVPTTSGMMRPRSPMFRRETSRSARSAERSAVIRKTAAIRIAKRNSSSARARLAPWARAQTPASSAAGSALVTRPDMSVTALSQTSRIRPADQRQAADPVRRRRRNGQGQVLQHRRHLGHGLAQRRREHGERHDQDQEQRETAEAGGQHRTVAEPARQPGEGGPDRDRDDRGPGQRAEERQDDLQDGDAQQGQRHEPDDALGGPGARTGVWGSAMGR